MTTMESSLEDVDGCIKSIHVKNFFCHDNLEINFNRNVNFIVGRNGSGKSAILTALVVGLGGRASATNRGSKLHSFIKKGANSATVEIKIKNSSPKAYKPEEYGDCITVVRSLNASGGSSYKIKSATGEIKSTKLEDVNAIILAHDIQVDNPISVLNQDDARSFHASDAKKKYSLFRRATNLEKTETNYNRALENCRKAANMWTRKKESCAELEKEYKKWKRNHEQLQSRDEIEAKRKALQNEYYWSEIAELERETAKSQEMYDRQDARIQKLKDKLSMIEENFGSNNDVIDKLKSDLEEKRAEKSNLEQQLRGLETELREIQGTWRKATGAFSEHRRVLERERRKIADLQTEIDNIDSGSSTSRRSELEGKVTAAQEALQALTARHDTARNDAAQARANTQHAQSRADEFASRVSRQRNTIRQLEQQRRELESRGNDSLSIYGNSMVELVNRVKQAAARNVFSKPPLGPVGSFLKVKEKRWGGALEHILGGSVQSFCVDTPEDSRKLFDIMGKISWAGSKPSVTCSKFLTKIHDVKRNKVRARGFTCALDAFDVANPVIANYLIDNLGLESILLVPTHEEAVRLAETEENVPESCSKIVTLDASEYYPAPNYRSYGGAGRNSRFLHISTAERKKLRTLAKQTNIKESDSENPVKAPSTSSEHLTHQLLAEIEEAKSELQNLEAQAQSLSEEVRVASANEHKASKAVQALMNEKHEKEQALRVANAALEQLQAPHHAVLLDELKISKEKTRKLQEQLDEFSTKEQQFREIVEDIEGKMRTVKSQLGQANSTCRTLSEEIEQEQLKMDQGSTERHSLKQKLKEEQQKLAQVETALREKQEVVAGKVTQAQRLCDRIERPRDLAIVTMELKKTELRLSSIRSEGLSKQQVSEKLVEVQRKYIATKEKLDRLQDLIKQIKSTTDSHLKFCHQIQTYIVQRVQNHFQCMLRLRGFSGSMDIDNVNGTLEIKCTGRESATKRLATSTSSLSGGERSYSTVAFIMALWECVELPFYFMDEFDVFMDNMNRKYVMEILVTHALNNPNRQYVFLTPQDASSVTSGPQISIHRMADPRP